jgi:SAM-dependent methyltransferase
MIEESAAAYARMVDASEAQRRRNGAREETAERWTASAARFQADPRREPDANLRAIMEYVRPEHVLLDVGGGAGRYSLPIALRCREVIDVDPAPGMCAAFEESAKAAGIGNARAVCADWLSAAGIEGDVSLVANVTYFVREIVPFVEKLIAASRERVIIAVSATPPPNQSSLLYQVVHAEPQALVPGHRELLPVLWDMGILPEVRVLETAVATALGGVSPSREEAVAAAANAQGLSEEEAAAAAKRIEARFDELFYAVEGGYRRLPSGDPRLLLITWRTRG